jgi:chromosome segregation ATPase
MEINIGETSPILPPPANQNSENQMLGIYETINTLFDDMQRVNDDTQHLLRVQDQLRDSIESLMIHSSVLRTTNQEQNARITGIQHDQETLQQDLATTQRIVEERQSASYDGTLTWKITGVREKISKYSKKTGFIHMDNSVL